MSIIPEPNLNITANTFTDIINEKKNFVNICSKYYIKPEEFQQILYSSGDSIFSIKQLLYFKYREYKRSEVQKMYNIIYHNVCENQTSIPDKQDIENIILSNNRLLKYYQLEFRAYNQYMRSLLTNEQCFICQDNIDTYTTQKNITIPQEAFTTLQCNHCFHISCIGEWLKNNDDCPTCRHVVQRRHSHNRNEESGYNPNQNNNDNISYSSYISSVVSSDINTDINDDIDDLIVTDLE